MTIAPEISDRTRAHADRLGLAAEGIVPPATEARAINERIAEWNSSLKPWNPFEVWLAEQVAVS